MVGSLMESLHGEVLTKHGANETSQWIGSNFYQRCRPCDFIFDNNPFNYLPHEEQYITNPKAIKLLKQQETIRRYRGLVIIIHFCQNTITYCY
jgi:hypothetical protein